jgi:hypothetical protein
MGKLESESVKEATWRNHFGRDAASKTCAAFCRAEGISAAKFYAWRARLANEVHSRSARPSPRSGFIDIRGVNGIVESTATGQAAETASPPRTLRIDIGDGIVLTITTR